MSTAYIWRYRIYDITIYSGHLVNIVHNFHVVLLGLHPVAHDMKQGMATCCPIISEFKNIDQEYNYCEICQFVT